jgi:hypothetical protein
MASNGKIGEERIASKDPCPHPFAFFLENGWETSNLDRAPVSTVYPDQTRSTASATALPPPKHNAAIPLVFP